MDVASAAKAMLIMILTSMAAMIVDNKNGMNHDLNSECRVFGMNLPARKEICS